MMLYFDSVNMLNYKGGFPRRGDSPDAITPGQVLRHPRSVQGRNGGRHLSPPSSYQHLEFHSKGKESLQSHSFIIIFELFSSNNLLCHPFKYYPGQE